MKSPSFPTDEPQRLKALRALELLDTAAEERFDRLTRLVQKTLGVPMATLSLVDAHRQWFKSRQGLADCETPRDISFCGHGILDVEIFEITDARLDPRFTDNPLVTGPPHIRFYAGAPIATHDGYRIGMLCALSDKPRQLSDHERGILRELADCVEAEINALEEHRLRTLLADSQARSNKILGALPDIVFLVDRDGICLECNDHDQLFERRSEILGRRIGDFLPASLKTPWQEALEQALASSEIVRFDYVLPERQGGGTFEARIQRLNKDEVLVLVRNVSVESAAQAELKRLSRVANETTNGVIITDMDGRVDWINEGFCRISGYTLKEMLGRKPGELLQGPESDPAIIDQMRDSLARRESFEVELVNYSKDGRAYWIHIQCSPLRGADGALEGFMAMQSDVTLQKEAEQRLEENERFLNTIVDSMPLPIFYKDAQGRYTGFNKAFETFFGQPRSALVGHSVFDIHPPELARIYHSQDKELFEQVCTQTYESQAKNAYGEVRDVIFHKATLTDSSGEITGLVGAIVDITDRKKADAEIHRLAYYDPLTDLPNRRLLQDRLRHAMAMARRSSNHGALVFLDIDDFKVLNDTRGHDAGDRLLIEIAQRIRTQARESDTIARLGGDEFVMMLEDLSADPTEAALQAGKVGEKIRLVLSKPYEITGGEYHCSASLGVALFDGNEESVETLLKQADLAMYKSKDSGRNTLRFFDPDMQTSLDERIALESDLRGALDLGQFTSYYQPQVDRKGRVLGAEVLLRWLHPVRGMVSPAEFIPLAESTGLILPIGHWVLENACRQLVIWSRNAGMKNLRLAVNVSAREFRQPDFVDQVKHVLSASGADPAQLRLELTESMVLEDVGGTFEKMEALKQLGIGFALDDFGTGHSSLAYLTRLPLDTLKIDSSFVFNLPDSHNDAVVAQTIISMARSLGLNVIAEGVETEAQRDFLALNHCQVYQGYLFSRPVPLEDFEKFCAASLEN